MNVVRDVIVWSHYVTSCHISTADDAEECLVRRVRSGHAGFVLLHPYTHPTLPLLALFYLLRYQPSAGARQHPGEMQSGLPAVSPASDLLVLLNGTRHRAIFFHFRRHRGEVGSKSWRLAVGTIHDAV